jgi:Pyruvate/2-oxoacid:ferredoxin oxidoreductase delta subunit
MADQPGKEGRKNLNKRPAGALFIARIKSMLCVVGCFECLAVCKFGVFRRTEEGKVEAASEQRCAGCLKCISVCRTKAIHILPGGVFSRTR